MMTNRANLSSFCCYWLACCNRGASLGEQVQTVAHNSLADVVKLTREKLAMILDTKLFDIKYGSKARQCMERRVAKVGSYAYDMAMFFHPIHADLAFIDTMAKVVGSGDASYKGESQVIQSKGLVIHPV